MILRGSVDAGPVRQGALGLQQGLHPRRLTRMSRSDSGPGPGRLGPTGPMTRRERDPERDSDIREESSLPARAGPGAVSPSPTVTVPRPLAGKLANFKGLLSVSSHGAPAAAAAVKVST